MTALGWVLLTTGTAAVVEDLACRQVSNWISGAALISGFMLHCAQQGWHGAMTALAGSALGFVVFAVFYLLHALGGGDVKLMAGFGSLLGPVTILRAAWVAAVAGGLMAVAAAVVGTVRAMGSGGRSPARAETIPYAPAIVAGVWLAEIARG